MLSYQMVDAQSIPVLCDYFARQSYRSCDYTAGTTYMWARYFSSEYAVKNGMLFLYMRYPDGMRYHLLPVGSGDPIASLAFLTPDDDGLLRLTTVPEKALDALKVRYGAQIISICEERKWADYLYMRESLATYAGRKLAGQRNHVNRFMKEYGAYIYEELTQDNAAAFRAFLLEHRNELQKPDPIAQAEYGYALEMFDHINTLHCSGGILRLPNHDAAGICLGTIVGDTFYEHVEKALHTVPGASQLLCRECAAHQPQSVVYINREDDMGDEGLRAAKLALHPCALVKKYTVIIRASREGGIA